MAKIMDFFKDKEKKAPVQGYVPAELREKVIDQMRLDRDAGVKITWNSLLEAACQVYLQERKKSVK